MTIKLTYPPKSKMRSGRRFLLSILRWPFIAAAIACPIVNLAVGGPAWSIIALLSLYAVWTMVLSTDLVEYNRTSQTIKTVVFICVLLTLIDVLLAPGWAAFVVPLVYFGGIILSTVLFFTNFEKQKHNILPLILFLFFGILGSAVALSIWHEHDFWPYIVTGSTSLLCLVVIIISMGQDFLRELKRRFHVK
ncbi:MAG: hypothetical protein IJ459_02285 [Clostridia bacterium]|nr:hypothetical protein [Clostridia bacterium]